MFTSKWLGEFRGGCLMRIGVREKTLVCNKVYLAQYLQSITMIRSHSHRECAFSTSLLLLMRWSLSLSYDEADDDGDDEDGLRDPNAAASPADRNEPSFLLLNSLSLILVSEIGRDGPLQP